jgi:tRNA nucleotidyltransferase/poly(A) polymerase
MHEKNILKKLSSQIPEAYMVGGILRDYFLQKMSPDLDIALPAINTATVKKIAKAVNAQYFLLDEKNMTYRFITKEDKLQMDISVFAGGSLEKDLLRRDFTINALAYPLKEIKKEKIILKKICKDTSPLLKLTLLDKEKIIDPSTCMKNIAGRTVKMVSENSFGDDPLRMIRVFRFAAQFGFKIDGKTSDCIKNKAKKINSVSGERIQDEILKLLSYAGSAYWFGKMDKSGLLKVLIPQLEASRKCAVVYYGKGGVLKHTFEVLDRVEFLFANLKKIFPRFHKKIDVWKEKISILKLAALLHDIAKLKTAKMMQGRLRFFYHEDIGAEMAGDILNSLCCSKNNSKLICSVIKGHLRIGNLAANPVITDKAVYRFFTGSESFSIPLLLLCWADYASYISKQVMSFAIKAGGLERTGTKKTLRHLQVINLMLKIYFYHKPKFAPTKLLDGNEVMKALKIGQSKKVGDILENVRLSQIEGRVKTKKDALAYIKKL